MPKVKLGPRTLLYPMPALLIGTQVDGKANFMTAAWSGIANNNPPMLTVAIQHHRYTLKGIRATGIFSVNVPSLKLIKEVDYCGIVSGSQEDKVTTCGFTIFYGLLKTAPMIEECPLNLECSLEHSLKLGTHSLLVGKIEEVHVSDGCLMEGEPEMLKVDPLVYGSGATKSYYSIGSKVGPAFSIGMELKKSKGGR